MAEMKPWEIPDAQSQDVMPWDIQPSAAEAYNQLPWYLKIPQAADDTVRMLANGMTLGYADKLAGYMGGEGTEAERAKSQQAMERAGSAGTAAEIVGVMAPASAFMKGASLARLYPVAMTGAKGVLARTLSMAGQGGALGGMQALGHDENPVEGAAYGSLFGAAGNLGAEALTAGGTKLSRMIQTLRANPKTRAEGEIFDLAGRTPAMRQALDDLGPDAMLVDALGERGLSLGRNAANINPAARETLEAAVLGRKAGQNVRLASDVEAAAGLPIGSTKGLDTLKADAFNAVRPQINAAYASAKAAGYDLPLDAFKDITSTPMGKRAYAKALASLKNKNIGPSSGTVDDWMGAFGPQRVDSSLAILDEMKQALDDMAGTAYRAGSKNQGNQARDLAKALRTRMDDMLQGDEYAAARALRQKAYKTDEAFDLGAELARGRIPMDTPGKAAALADEFKPPLAKGYGAQQVENLLNRGSTEGAMNSLTTPMGRRAASAALGPNAQRLEQALAREKAFNRTARALTGNSTTARQLAEMAGTGLGTTGTAMMMGFDPATATASGMLGALLRKGAPAVTKKLATGRQKAAAPFLADLLTGRTVPGARPIPPGWMEHLSQSQKKALIQMLVSSGIVASGQQ